ncbi:MAG: TfoX/Sxy family protein [Alphaproteobacteria bacterium]|nr:TfoX/Sxy family protein [Alphaproteobacteria bacterium]
MAVSAELRDHILDLLDSLGVRARSMFGGVGFFADRLMFAVIVEDRFYLKVDDGNRPAFKAAGCLQWVYDSPSRGHVPMPYWEAPEALLDDSQEMISWARKAIAVAERAAIAKRTRKKPSRKVSASAAKTRAASRRKTPN